MFVQCDHFSPQLLLCTYLRYPPQPPPQKKEARIHQLEQIIKAAWVFYFEGHFLFLSKHHKCHVFVWMFQNYFPVMLLMIKFLNLKVSCGLGYEVESFWEHTILQTFKHPQSGKQT